jgi:hypothetical protein
VRVLERYAIPRIDHEGPAAGGEASGKGEAESAGGAGHECHRLRHESDARNDLVARNRALGRRRLRRWT